MNIRSRSACSGIPKRWWRAMRSRARCSKHSAKTAGATRNAARTDAMSPDRIDLNLLRVFDAIFEDRNLALAGKRLNLSQSAISHALGRMRDTLGDDLFIRTGRGMEPTVRAHAMAMQVRGALAQIKAA